MPGLPNWLSQSQAPASAPVPGSSPWTTTNAYNKPRPQDPNAPDRRLDIGSKCVYERQLPGGSYITAHVRRLQSGYYDSPVIHEDCISDTRFIALNFVFHEASTDRRFKSAKIRISIHDENRRPKGITPLPPQFDRPADDDPAQEPPKPLPKFLRFAPHLLYGAMSPETLDWNFNLAGSLGVSQTPVSASINPSGGVKSSYKVYKMMKIQGSLRTNSSWFGKNYDVEDGELVWTLEENYLQKSGLPREFTFVMLLAKGHPSNKIAFEIDIEPDVASWFGGSFPQWWVHLLKYQPLYKEPLDLDRDVGQKFEPCDGPLGFNFAQLMSTFDDFVTLPGTTYSARDVPFTTPQTATDFPGGDPSQQQQTAAKSTGQSQQQPDSQRQGSPNNTVHLRIHLDQSPKRSHSISTTYPYPEAVPKPRRVPQPVPALEHSTQTDATIDSTTKPTTRTSRLTRRLTVGSAPTSTVTSTPPKPKAQRPTPLETHYEEKEYFSSPAPETTTQTDDELDCEYAFPEPAPSAPRPPTQPRSSRSSSHRHTKSSSTASPIPKPATLDAPSSTANPPLTSKPSLRRIHSRSGLRSASLGSHPEPDADDAASISAAMDMLTGSPPPPSASPVPDPQPRRPLQHINPDRANKLDHPDMKLATPRTRAALADRIEIERAERERVERRNGNLNSDFNGHTQHNRHENLATKPVYSASSGSGPGPASGRIGMGPPPGTGMGGYDDNSVLARARERERMREKRYSMPVTSTGIGYPSNSTFGTRSAARSDETGADLKPDSYTNTNTNANANANPNANTKVHANASTKATAPVNAMGGNGRSSLMIPVGNIAKTKRENGGLGIGVGVGNNTGRAGSFRRDGGSGVYSGYEYIE